MYHMVRHRKDRTAETSLKWHFMFLLCDALELSGLHPRGHFQPRGHFLTASTWAVNHWIVSAKASDKGVNLKLGKYDMSFLLEAVFLY